jgi:adenosine kinase
MTIVCSGSIAYDYLMTFPGYFREHILPDRLDSISLSFLVDTMVRQRGGIGANIAYTLALLGDHPLLVGTVGEDFTDYRLWLNSKGIDTRFVRVVPGKFTASFFVTTDLDNNQIASFYTGAMANASEIRIHELANLNPELVVISPNDPQTMSLHARQCGELNIPYLYDPSQQIVRLDPVDLRTGVEGAHSLFVNEYEFELLQKHTGLSSHQILSMVEIMVVTLGKQGAVIYVEGEEYHISAIEPEKMVDPTGVGDAFRGGFLRGYQLGLDWQTCGQMGSLAAAYCLEQRGTQAHSFTPAEFVARYRTCFEDRGELDVLIK